METVLVPMMPLRQQTTDDDIEQMKKGGLLGRWMKFKKQRSVDENAPVNAELKVEEGKPKPKLAGTGRSRSRSPAVTINNELRTASIPAVPGCASGEKCVGKVDDELFADTNSEDHLSYCASCWEVPDEDSDQECTTKRKTFARSCIFLFLCIVGLLLVAMLAWHALLQFNPEVATAWATAITTIRTKVWTSKQLVALHAWMQAKQTSMTAFAEQIRSTFLSTSVGTSLNAFAQKTWATLEVTFPVLCFRHLNLFLQNWGIIAIAAQPGGAAAIVDQVNGTSSAA